MHCHRPTQFTPHTMNSITRLLIVIATVILTACAGTPVNSSASLTDISTMAVIVFSVSHDVESKRGATAIFYLDNKEHIDRAVLKSVQDNLNLAHSGDFSDRRGHLYILQVKPGHHQFDGWQVSSAGARISGKVSPTPLTFDAKPGEAIYLGNLHARLLLGHRTIFGGRAAYDAIPLVQDMSQQDIPLAESRTPALKGRIKISLLPIGPWLAPGETVKRVDPIPMPVIVPKK